MTNLIFAGTDTTSNTLSYMFYALAKFPEWQAKLQAEVDSIATDGQPREELSHAEVMKLPILDAVIRETLRFYPAAPSALQRVAVDKSKSFDVDGITVPGNVCHPHYNLG